MKALSPRPAAARPQTPASARSQPPAATGLRYDRRTVLMHWATVVLVLSLWGTAQLIDLFPRGEPRYPMRSAHMLLGVLLGALLLGRMHWRATRGRRLPGVGSPAARAAGRAVHLLLYGLLAAEVVLGLANTWVRGDHVYLLFQVPAFDPGNLALRRTVGNLHHWCANLVLALAGLHAAAALFHHFVLRDTVLARMRLKGPL